MHTNKTLLLILLTSLSTPLFSQDIYTDISTLSGFNAPHNVKGPFEGGIPGTGQSFIDINNDGLQDIIVSNQVGDNKLFINQGNETFSESTAFQNIALTSEKCKGVSVADYDNDGWDDIYFSCNGDDYLFKNNNGNSITDVTVQAGIINPYNSQASAWADINNDGWLDLYVINYDIRNPAHGTSGDLVADAFYLSNGNGTFTDIIAEFDINQVNKPNLAVTFFDYDNDGDQDLYVITDKLRGNVLWENDGPAVSGCGVQWCFRDVSVSSNANSLVFGMGVATGDIDNDGDFDLFFSSIDEQTLLINQNSQGTNTFIDASVGSALNLGVGSIGWATMFFDYNNDAWIDAYIATHNNTAELSDTLFNNNHDGTFDNMNLTCGATNLLKSEGAAHGDFNNDGKIDIVLANFDNFYEIYKNSDTNTNNWIKIKLIGGLGINLNAIGSRVTVLTNDNISQIREVNSGSSRGAGNERTLHFGLGSSTISTMEIIWPNGITQNLNSLNNNQLHTIKYADFISIFSDNFE